MARVKADTTVERLRAQLDALTIERNCVALILPLLGVSMRCARPCSRCTRLAKMTENPRAIAKLNAPDSDLSKDEAKQKAAFNKLRQHLAAEATEEEKQAVADAPVGKLREEFGVDQTKVMPVIQDRWGSEEEATILATFSQQVKAIYGWCTDVFNGALGNTANINVAQVENEFRVLAKKHGIADDVADALAKHHKDRLG